MPYFATAQEWLDQSKLLLAARPSTTKITTRYATKPVKPRQNPKTDDDTPAAAAPKPPRGTLVLKTYDPHSGVTLKYRTTKAAEVSRLIHSSLGSVGRGMAAVPEAPAADEAMPDAPAPLTSEVVAAGENGVANAAQVQQGSGGGGGKKKKKGKK